MQKMKLTIVRVGVAMLGLIGIATGARAIYLGVNRFLGDTASSQTLPDSLMFGDLDNDFRYFGAIWFMLGFGLLYSALKIDSEVGLFRFGMIAMIVGALARVFGMVQYGPLPAHYPAVAVEIVFPLLFLFLHWSSRRADNQSVPQPN